MANYTLSSIVKEYIIETLGDEQLNRYKRFYYLGTSFLRENSYDMTGGLCLATLLINDNDTVDLPPDYLNYSKIGVCGMDGNIYALGRNDSICLEKAYDICGVPVVPVSDNLVNGIIGLPITPDFYASHYRNGEMMGKFFGIGGGNNSNGYYRIDKGSNQIKLNGVNLSVSSILLEYISDLTAVDNDMLVHPFIVNTLKCWLSWKSIANDRSRSLGEKQMAQSDYWLAYKTSRARFNPATVKEWMETVRSGNKGSVKF